MADDEAPKTIHDDGANLTAITQQVADYARQVVDLRKQREETNAEIAEVRAKVEALGVQKKAFDDAVRYQQADPEKRQGYDLSYSIARKAVGLPMDLFDSAGIELPEQSKGEAAV